MKPPKAVIAEDEPVLRSELKEMLAKLWPELMISAEAEDGIEAVHALHTHAPDILFLDIQMPGMSRPMTNTRWQHSSRVRSTT